MVPEIAIVYYTHTYYLDSMYTGRGDHCTAMDTAIPPHMTVNYRISFDSGQESSLPWGYGTYYKDPVIVCTCYFQTYGIHLVLYTIGADFGTKHTFVSGWYCSAELQQNSLHRVSLAMPVVFYTRQEITQSSMVWVAPLCKFRTYTHDNHKTTLSGYLHIKHVLEWGVGRNKVCRIAHQWAHLIITRSWLLPILLQLK